MHRPEGRPSLTLPSLQDTLVKRSLFHSLGGPGRSPTTFQLGGTSPNLSSTGRQEPVRPRTPEPISPVLSPPPTPHPPSCDPNTKSWERNCLLVPARWASWGPGPHWGWAWGQGRACVNQWGIFVALLLPSQRTVKKRFHGDAAGGPCQRERAG